KITENVAEVSASLSHTTIMKTNGEVYAFGVNSSNAFGFTTDAQYVHEHTRVFEDFNVHTVSCGVGHTSFITTANNLYTVGLNYFGQIGDGTTTDRLTPVLVKSNVRDTFADSYITAVIDTDGVLYAVGDNGKGLCGLPYSGSVLFVMDGMRVLTKKTDINHSKQDYGLYIVDETEKPEYEVFTFKPDERTQNIIHRAANNEYANCYDYLTPYEKHMYESLDRAVPDTHDNFDDGDVINVPFISLSNQANAPFSAALAAWYAYCYDHPEAFWLNSYSVSVYFPFYYPHGEDFGFAVKPMFDSAAEVALAEAKINQKIDVIINGDDNDMYEKLRKAYDYVVSLNEPNANTYSDNPLEHSAYSVFCDDELSPLPAAYANAMKIICDKLGIYSVITRGRYEGKLVYWLTVKADDGEFYVLDAYQEAKDGSDCFLKGASFMENREYSIEDTMPNMCYPTLCNHDYVQGNYEMYEYERTPVYSYTYNPTLSNIPNTTAPEGGKSYILACEFNGKLYALRAENISYAGNMAKGMSAVDITSIDSINDSALVWKVIEGEDNLSFELENQGGKLSAYSYLKIKEPGKSGSVFSYDASTGRLIDTKNRCLRLFTAIMDNPVFDSKIRGWSDCDYSRIVFIEYVWQTGDVNMDCSKNTGDAALVLQYYAGLVTLNEDQKVIADVTGDGKVNTGDAIAILKILVS
ncbi:MAG: hypothetical protein GX802_04750, partial [Clostridiales bacterium]|nr:hypothetical protein [Clostridiales bacterium]